MRITTLECPPIGTNAYLIEPPDSPEALLVDAPLQCHDTVRERLHKQGRHLAAVLLTHGHWDHMLDLHAFAAEGIPIYAHLEDRPRIEDPRAYSLMLPPQLEARGVTAVNWLEGEQTLQLAGQTIELREVPGHAPGSYLYFFPSADAAFSGDAIFAGGVGRTDFPDASAEQLEQSIRERIYTLPPQTQIFPGHGPSTTVDQEMRTNPFVRP